MEEYINMSTIKTFEYLSENTRRRSKLAGCSRACGETLSADIRKNTDRRPERDFNESQKNMQSTESMSKTIRKGLYGNERFR